MALVVFPTKGRLEMTIQFFHIRALSCTQKTSNMFGRQQSLCYKRDINDPSLLKGNCGRSGQSSNRSSPTRVLTRGQILSECWWLSPRRSFKKFGSKVKHPQFVIWVTYMASKHWGSSSAISFSERTTRWCVSCWWIESSCATRSTQFRVHSEFKSSWLVGWYTRCSAC